MLDSYILEVCSDKQEKIPLQYIIVCVDHIKDTFGQNTSRNDETIIFVNGFL